MIKETRKFDVLKVSSSNRNVPRFGTEVKAIPVPDDTCVTPELSEDPKKHFHEIKTRGVTSKMQKEQKAHTANKVLNIMPVTHSRRNTNRSSL